MALTADQRLSFYELFGVPSNPSALVQTDITTPRFIGAQGLNPSYMNQDFTNLQTQIEAILTALDSAQEARVIAFLVTYDSISTSPLNVQSSAEAQGSIVNHPAQVEKIRQRVSDVVGYTVPFGGFSESYRRKARSGNLACRY